MKKYIVLLLLIVGCASKSNKPAIKIGLTNSKLLEISGISDDILQELNRDSLNTTAWQTLFPVFRMPADTDMKDLQIPQQGKYAVIANTVIFTPDTPFKSRQVYFVRYYQYGANNAITEYIKYRKRLGKASYEDLIF